MTNQLQLVGFGVLVEVFPEAQVAARVKDERKRVVRSGIDPEEPDNVGVRDLCKHPYFVDESLKWNVNRRVCEESSFLTRDVPSIPPVS